jgi:hypothetical protein
MRGKRGEMSRNSAIYDYLAHCKHKKKYKTKRDAKHKVKERVVNGKPEQNIYRCKYCYSWHIGGKAEESEEG